MISFRVIVGIVGLVALGVLAGWFNGKERTRVKERREQGRVLIASNLVWLGRLDSLRRIADKAQVAADSVAEVADSLGRRRREVPKPQVDAPADVKIAYWKGQAEEAEKEAGSWEMAYEREKRASAALRIVVDSLGDRLRATSSSLGSSLDREEGKGKLLGFIPRPSKLVAAIAGCVLGAAVDHGDVLRGCGLGGIVTVVTLPTR